MTKNNLFLTIYVMLIIPYKELNHDRRKGDIQGTDHLVVTVVVGTDARNMQRDYPTNVRVTADETGLTLDTVFLCFQLRSLDHSRFMNPVTQQTNLSGKMPDPRMADVDKALRMTLMI